MYFHPFAAGCGHPAVSQLAIRGGVRVRCRMSSSASTCARRWRRRVAGCLCEGTDQKVRPALKCTSVVLLRNIGDVWVCVPLRAANMGAGVVGAGFGLRCLMSSPEAVSGAGVWGCACGTAGGRVPTGGVFWEWGGLIWILSMPRRRV